ncbi:putative RNA-directed DNA polymerase [Tanacetum coccineum]|uniref:RNA-directed DNA polymerase n=1 Tax=Tanacetum coccineum TaxID=301880 RepID=A0ABQ4WMW2_9ASTR
MLANRMRENQLAHMSLDEEVCGTGMSWLCAPTELSYAKGLPKKAETPQVMMIKGGKIQKSNKKSLKAKEVGHCKRNCHAYLAKLSKKKKQVGTASSLDVFIIELFSFPTKSEVYDTSCGTHICNTKHGFGGARKLKQVEAIGSFDIDLPNDLVICLDNCHYAHSIIKGVVSVHRLVENGLVQCFTHFRFSVSKNNVFYFNAIPSNGIYEIDMHNLVPNVNSMYNVSTKRATHNLDSTYLGHCHFAHISKKHIEKLQQGGILKSKYDESFDHCVSCLSVKMTRKSFPHRLERVTDLLGIIHTDVCGLLRHVSRQGASYFITFTDDYSLYGYVYLLKHKLEVFETFKVFKNKVENQLGKTIKAIRLDRGGEYIRQGFKDYLKACGIVQQLTPPYIPQHNGVSKRRNHTLLDMVRSMMNLTTLPLSFYDYALESATRILNMVSTKKPDKTPYELWYGKIPNLSYLKAWGCEALDIQIKQWVTLFYFPPENKIVVARYAEFFEKNLITQEVSGRAIDLEEIQDEDTSSEITCEIPMEVEGFKPPQDEEIPIRSYKAAMLDSESNKWIDAMNTAIQSMMDNMVWVLVDLPPGCKNVRSKWIFKKKTDMDGIVHTYKARLVAKGYTQLYGVNYEETFSPVADIRAIRILISIAAYYDYEIWQMDVKTTFLNGYLDEDIYMVQPEGFVDPNHLRKVCKLQRSIYGLKQASRSWNKRFDEEIKRFGFSQNLDEPWEAAFILRIKIYRDRSKRLIGLGQNAYMDKILKRYRMDNSKRGHIPMQERLDLNKSQGAQTPKEVNRVKNVPYASVVGSIMYAVRCTRTDVVFAQNMTSQFQQNPGELHWTTVKNILKYLRNTKDMYLVYGGNPSTELIVECYCNAGFETDIDDMKSLTTEA